MPDDADQQSEVRDSRKFSNAKQMTKIHKETIKKIKAMGLLLDPIQ
jgi:hypothetical protein